LPRTYAPKRIGYMNQRESCFSVQVDINHSVRKSNQRWFALPNYQLTHLINDLLQRTYFFTYVIQVSGLTETAIVSRLRAT
jgi:hypothetical protein